MRTTISRRTALRACACVFATGGAWMPRLALSAELPFGFIHHGNFRRMMHSGDAAGQVLLSALPQQPGWWGLGALGDLKGEIIEVNGRLRVTLGSHEQGRTQDAAAGDMAVLFAAAQVPRWHDITVPADKDQAAFEAFVQAQARDIGLSLEQPFVFRVEGHYPHLLWHVVTGEPAAQSGQGGGHGAGAHGGNGDHANSRSDMRLFRQPGARGQLVGVYSGVALEGVVSHPGERFHVHYADADVGVSGHVDRYSVAAGSVLKLPMSR